MLSFRASICITSGVYILVASLFATGIIVSSINRSNYISENRKYFKSTLITIESYKTTPGICRTCVILFPTPPARNDNTSDCTNYPGYYAYAIVSYDVWLNSSVFKYRGNTPENQWCDSSPSEAIFRAQSEYGNVGKVYNGYYLLKDPSKWLWYMPGHYKYDMIITGLSFLIFITISVMIIHLAALCKNRRNKYKVLQ